VRILSDEQLEQFKSATLTILDEVGVHCPSQIALRIYAEHGAEVDLDDEIVRLPPEVVVEAMSHAPRTYTLGGRDERFDLSLDGNTLACGTDGTGVETVDFETRERRHSIKDDVARSARIADYVSAVGFYWPMVSAQDCGVTAPLHELDAAFRNTVKHVQTETVMDEATAHFAVEMARVIAGDGHAMRERPPLSLLVCTIAPLGLDRGGMESALAFAEAGLPVGFMSMANSASTAPATSAGLIAQADAEMVAAMVLVQMAFPGAPTFHSLMPGITHPRTGGYLCPESHVYAVGVELAHMWGVPALAGTFGGDAAQPGWHMSRMEGGGLLLCALCGAEMGNGMGLLQGSTVLYPEALLLDADVYHSVRRDVAGVDTSEDALALEVVGDVGPRGHFLGQDHTRRHVHRWDLSELTTEPDGAGGYRDPIEVAREKTTWILENHQPRPLGQAQQAELTRILRSAEGEVSR
jgi:trimethylamine--corrinoid protein Co-methyltransferase